MTLIEYLFVTLFLTAAFYFAEICVSGVMPSVWSVKFCGVVFYMAVFLGISQMAVFCFGTIARMFFGQRDTSNDCPCPKDVRLSENTDQNTESEGEMSDEAGVQAK